MLESHSTEKFHAAATTSRRSLPPAPTLIALAGAAAPR
jgi:hypothetical protein